MSRVAVRAERLGKRYRVGASASYSRFSEALVRAPVAAARAVLSTGAADSAEAPPANDASEYWALQDVSFEVAEGEVLGVIGRNGAGKSTLLKLLSRITEPTTGRFGLRGRVASLLEVGTGFHPELTGRENVYLSGSILGMTRSEIRSRFDEIVSFAEIEGFLDTPVKRYSSGMYVRLGFAIAAHLRPEILIVDEVLAVGDAQFQRKCMGKMGEVAEGGRTVLFVSHNIGAIRRLCGRSMLLEKGRARRIGATSAVLDAYADEAGPDASQATIAIAPDASKRGQFEHVALRRENGAPTVAFGCDEPVVLAFRWRRRASLAGLYFGVAIESKFGEVVLYADSRDDELECDGPETATIEVRIPPRSLAASEYRINLTAAEVGSTPVDKRFGVCGFRLTDERTLRGDSRPGYLSTILGWEVVEAE